MADEEDRGPWGEAFRAEHPPPIRSRLEVLHDHEVVQPGKPNALAW
jgi:hypothetical protein